MRHSLFAIFAALVFLLNMTLGSDDAEARSRHVRQKSRYGRQKARHSSHKARSSAHSPRYSRNKSRINRKKKTRLSRHQNLCPASKVSATNYFLPREGVTPNFRFHVKLQGSGVLKNGKVLTYTGRRLSRPSHCKTTVTSASGRCLMPYFSIAADPRYYSMGDIIYIPEAKKMKIKLPGSHKYIQHPGYFVVDDTGGAIKGRNRFDFFTGLDDPMRMKSNPFQSLGMTDKRMCRTSFAKVDRSRLNVALNAICRYNDRPECGDGRIQVAESQDSRAIR